MIPAGTVEPLAQTASPVDAVFGMLDRNNDGVITRGEWNQAMHSAQVTYAVGTRAAPGVATPAATQRPVGSASVQADMGTLRRNLAANTYRVQALAAEDAGLNASPPRPTSGGSGRAQTSMSELRRGLASHRQEQDMQAALVQDAMRESDAARATNSSLASERDRLQRQVQEVRGQVADAKNELATQQENYRLQTAELRATMNDLQSETSRMQNEQRRQARALADVQSKKGTAGTADVTPQLVKQVESVKGAVDSQEQKLARIEATVAEANAIQRGQLREALEQGRHLSRALEDEANRRQHSITELQQLIIQERGRDNHLPAKLQAELVKATSTMQAQTGDWVELARVIKQEVGTLASELRADRDSRALEASSQRHEITRMLEETRLANVAASVGATGSFASVLESELGTEMMSKAGAVAVHKMVDTTKALLHGLEEALILRAGFIAGVFHTWRYEVAILKVGARFQLEFENYQAQMSDHVEAHRRSFEDELRRAAEHHLTHKEYVQQRTELLLQKWAYGEAMGNRNEAFTVWARYTSHEKSLQRTAKSIHKACTEWVEGKDKALKHECYLNWRSLTMQQGEARKMMKSMEDKQKEHDAALQKVQAEAEARAAELVAKMQSHNSRAKSDLQIMINKWSKGNTKGVLSAIWQGWQFFISSQRVAKQQSKSAQTAMNSFLGGQRRGVLMSTWDSWKNEIHHSRAVEAERKRFEELLNNNRAEREEAEKDAKDDAKRKLEAAHQAVQMALTKSLLGEAAGLQKDIFTVWVRWSKEKAKGDRRKATVHMQMNKWIAGNERGTKQGVFMNWKASAMEAASEKKYQERLAKERAGFDSFLNDERKKHENEIAKHKTEAERRKDLAKSAVEQTIAKWNMGEQKGLLDAVLRNWNTTVKEIKTSARKRNAVRDALMRSVAGEARANLQMTFLSWKGIAKEQHKNRTDQEKIELAKAQWEEKERELMMLTEQALSGAQGREAEAKAKAHAASEMMLRRWMGGDTKGTLSAVFVDWRRLKDAMKETRRKRKSVSDSINRFILGEKQGILSSVLRAWANWVQMTKQANDAIARLEKRVEKLLRKQEVSLTKYAGILGAADSPTIKRMVLSQWRDIAQGVKALETEREREVALEELKRANEIAVAKKKELQARAALGMGVKNDKILLTEVFLAWKLEFEKGKQEQAHKLNHNKAMKEMATQMVIKQFRKDSKALLASTFAEWRREGKIIRHEEAHNESQNRLQDYMVAMEELQMRYATLEEQLRLAYRQLDSMTETLQKEQQTKEELTEHLREAYSTVFSPPATTAFVDVNGVGGLSRPNSAQSRSRSTGKLDSRRVVGGMQATRPGDGVFDVIDTNHDGVISRNEWIRAMGVSGDSAVASVSPPTATFASRPGRRSMSVVGSRQNSPSRCDWDAVLQKLKDERVLGARTNGGLPREPTAAI